MDVIGCIEPPAIPPLLVYQTSAFFHRAAPACRHVACIGKTFATALKNLVNAQTQSSSVDNNLLHYSGGKRRSPLTSALSLHVQP